MKRLLITGATGFLGSNTLPLLKESDYEIHAISRKNPQELTYNFPHINWHACDLFCENDVTYILNEVKPTHLLHYAWYVEHKKFWDALENFDWLLNTISLIKKFAHVGGQRIVISGTCAEYDWKHNKLSEDKTPLKPSTTYGKVKKSLFELVDLLSKKLNLSFAWGRIFFPYGPFEPESKLIPSAILNLLNDKPFTCANGNLYRDFIHIEDVASAFLKILDSDYEGPINIGTGKSFALSEIIYTLGEIMSRQHLLKVNNLEETNKKQDVLESDNNILTSKIGFKCNYDIIKGLEHAVDWLSKRTLTCKY